MSFSQTAVVKAAEGLAQIAYIRFRSQMIPNDGAHKVMICGSLLGRQNLSDRTIQKRRAAGQADHSLEESIEKLRDFIRDADDFVRCLAIEFEIKLGFRLAIIPLGKFFEFAPPQWPLRRSGEFDDDANARRLTGDSAFLRDCLAKVTAPRAMRPRPPSFSLAKTNTVSPLAICLPPYIVFCAVKTNVFARGSRTSALIANAMISQEVIEFRPYNVFY